MLAQNVGRFHSRRRFWTSSAILVVPFARLNVRLVTGFPLPHVVCRAPLSSCAVVHPPAWLSCHRHSATGYQQLPFNSWTFSPQEARWARSSSMSDYGIFLMFMMLHRVEPGIHVCTEPLGQLDCCVSISFKEMPYIIVVQTTVKLRPVKSKALKKGKSG